MGLYKRNFRTSIAWRQGEVMELVLNTFMATQGLKLVQ